MKMLVFSTLLFFAIFNTLGMSALSFILIPNKGNDEKAEFMLIRVIWVVALWILTIYMNIQLTK